MMINVVILAAGKGTRMRSGLPKVLQTLANKPLLAHVIGASKQIQAENMIVVYGHGGDTVKTTFEHEKISWVEQAEQLGTGHAVQVTLPSLPKTGKSIILYGDVPLIQPVTLERLVACNTSGLSMITLELENPFGMGRIVRDAEAKVQEIVEEKDADAQQKLIKEVNTGIYCVDNALLHELLPQLSNDNAQNEYYLTDIVKMAVAKGVEIQVIQPEFEFETDGVNNRQQLASLERKWQAYQVEQLQIQGVQFADPARVDIRGNVTVGQDVFIDTNVIINGDCELADNVTIGTGCVLTNTKVGKNTVLKPYCVVADTHIGESADIGPFVHLRPQTVLADKAKVGNFVEIKKSTVGVGSKVNHLSYIGDASIGKACNIGAGTITCNYDGANKHHTCIEDNAFVGTNTSLVAPVNIGAGATVGAGSVITKDVAQQQLAITRSKQLAKDNYQRPSKKDSK